MIVRGFALALVLAALLWSFRSWRSAVRAALVLVVLEGAIRKWVLPGAQDLVYFAKDFILLAVYAGYLAQGGRQRSRGLRIPPALTLLLLTMTGYVAVEAFNPQLPRLIIGLVGFRAYAFYIPLIWVVPAAFDDDRDLARFIRFFVLLAIPIGVLAALQFVSPGNSTLNTYARGAGEYATTFGSSTRVRVTGTFSYITGFSSYLLFVALLTLAVLATVRWKLRGNLPLFGALFAITASMLMTGSRGPVLIIVIMFPIYWLLAVGRGSEGLSTAARLGMALAVLGILLASSAPGAIEAFRGRAAGSTGTAQRLATPLTQPLELASRVGVIGFGAGSTHQAAATLARTVVPYSWVRGLVAEVETARVMIDLGVPGFLLVYATRIGLALVGLALAIRLRTQFHRAVATLGFLVCLNGIPGSVVFDPTNAVLYWFAVGLMFLVDRLDRNANVPVAELSRTRETRGARWIAASAS